MSILTLMSSKCQSLEFNTPLHQLLDPDYYYFNPNFTKTDVKKLDAINESIAQYSKSKLQSQRIKSIDDASEFLAPIFQGLKQEVLVALFLDTKNNIRHVAEIFKGSLNTSVAHPREIFRAALRYPTARIILAHNHPSGGVEPSQADISFTRRMVECGDMMGIELLDHFIVGDETLSLRQYCTRLFE